MTNPDFVQNVRLPNLGFGAATFMWGFRACALGHAQCGCLTGGFARIFGAKQGHQILGHLLGIARILGNDGRRPVTVAMPGCLGVTPDEAALLCALSAAQSSDSKGRDSHLRWLLAQDPAEQMKQLTEHVACQYLERGLMINAPEVTTGAVHVEADLAAMPVMGQA